MGEFTSKGVGNAALATGIIGTTLGALNGAGGLLNPMGGGNGANCAGNAVVNRYELGLTQEIAAKDGEIAILKSERYTDEKLVEVYKDLNGQIQTLKDAQNAANLQQAVFNGTTTSALSCINSQIAALQSLTKVVVPNTSVCPGWGNVTITPATTTTTTPAA